MKAPDRPLRFAGRTGWRAWLKRHHADEPAAWLLVRRAKASRGGLALEAAVEEALCFGWVDGVLRSFNAKAYLLRFSPRRSRSIWSAVNRQRAEKLIRQGRMTNAGLEKIAQAKANGQWQAAAAREDIEQVPTDLRRALKTRKAAWQTFRAWPASRKKQYLFWLASARKPVTRQKRIQVIVEMAGSGSQLERHTK